MSDTFKSSGSISMSEIRTFINNNVTANDAVAGSNVGLNNLFSVMRAQQFQPENGDFISPHKFSEMYNFLGWENEPPVITLIGDAEKSFLLGRNT